MLILKLFSIRILEMKKQMIFHKLNIWLKIILDFHHIYFENNF